MALTDQQRAPCSNKEAPGSPPSEFQRPRVLGIRASTPIWRFADSQLSLPEAETESLIGSGSFPESERPPPPHNRSDSRGQVSRAWELSRARPQRV